MENVMLSAPDAKSLDIPFVLVLWWYSQF